MIEKDKAKIESFLSKFYSEVDEIAKKYDNCCVNGCSYCCHQAIEMLSIESILISPFIKKYLSGVHLIRL